ncbi:hypothetical protein BBOV_III008405 [Babesia bovis T2Bo]|uniref:hypothetical protein n=1 Tax=Babesia bovis T2Bo TaxID=484906 RepID=UPI001C363FC9|nr:hypothetical protein BBOV_III008405 [Babesia bovis T2Bo]KAG6440074.1 hypothetical protein BBOV_III008405 [Babesia bovis T2Bo]
MEDSISTEVSKVNRKIDHKRIIKTLKQYKECVSRKVAARRLQIFEKKTELETLMSEYRIECQKLADQDTRELHEFYFMAKDEISKCAGNTYERCPVELNNDIIRMLRVMLKYC